jgi:sec-independent protein translocase protein TatA
MGEGISRGLASIKKDKGEYIMFGFGMPELILVLVIALVVVGPSKLPQLGEALGGSLRSFKKGVAGGENGRIEE